jgi:hydroxylaminobenzene mutase
MKTNKQYQIQSGRKLIQFGLLLFLLGLITGFLIPALNNPRMGLSSHLEGTLNGMLLMIFGLIWPKLKLSTRWLKWGYGLALFGTFTNWATTLFAAVLGAGGEMMPFAGGSSVGSEWQEMIIVFGLLSLSAAMLIVAVILLKGMSSSAYD